MLTREEVLVQAQREHSNAGRVVDEVPANWKCGKSCDVGCGCGCNLETKPPVYHFGIYWNETPKRLNVVTYGPGRNGDGSYCADRYVCWAS